MRPARIIALAVLLAALIAVALLLAARPSPVLVSAIGNHHPTLSGAL